MKTHMSSGVADVTALWEVKWVLVVFPLAFSEITVGEFVDFCFEFFIWKLEIPIKQLPIKDKQYILLHRPSWKEWMPFPITSLSTSLPSHCLSHYTAKTQTSLHWQSSDIEQTYFFIFQSENTEKCSPQQR